MTEDRKYKTESRSRKLEEGGSFMYARNVAVESKQRKGHGGIRERGKLLINISENVQRIL